MDTVAYVTEILISHSESRSGTSIADFTRAKFCF